MSCGLRCRSFFDARLLKLIELPGQRTTIKAKSLWLVDRVKRKLKWVLFRNEEYLNHAAETGVRINL